MKPGPTLAILAAALALLPAVSYGQSYSQSYSQPAYPRTAGPDVASSRDPDHESCLWRHISPLCHAALRLGAAPAGRIR